MKKTITNMLVLLTLLSGCVAEILPEPPVTEEEIELSQGEGLLRFSIPKGAQTRSSIDLDEFALDNVNIYAYCDGLLYAHVYSTTPQTASMKLKKGTRYNLYAVANASEMAAIQKEEDFIKNFKVSLGSIGEMNGKNLMSWSYNGYVLPTSSAQISMRMTRLYTKVNFHLDKGALKGLNIESVRLVQAARSVYPFHSEGSRAESVEDVMDGDYASQTDLDKLNTTEEGIYFYALENMQGTLLPTNNDPWEKNPDNIADRQELCTYIEVVGFFKEGFLYSGGVLYRFYLGKDNVRNFDIIRNKDMNIVLSISGDNFGEGLQMVSWKVNSDTTINPTGYASMRKISEPTYGSVVGDRAEYEVVLSDQLYNHLDNDINNCYVGVTDFTNHQVGDIVKEQMAPGYVNCTPLKHISSSPDHHVFTTVASFLRKNSYSFALYDKRTDTYLAHLDCREKTNRTIGLGFSTEKNNVCTDEYGIGNLLVVGKLPVSINEAPLVVYVHPIQLGDDTDPSIGFRGRNRAGVISGDTPAQTMSMDRSFFKDIDWRFLIKDIDGTVTSKEYQNLLTYEWTPAADDCADEYIGILTVRARNDSSTPAQDIKDYIHYTGSRTGSDLAIKFSEKAQAIYEDRMNTVSTSLANTINMNYHLNLEYKADNSLKPSGGTDFEAFNMAIVVHNPAKLPFKIKSLLQLPYMGDIYDTYPDENSYSNLWNKNKVGSFINYTRNSNYPLGSSYNSQDIRVAPRMNESRFTDYIEFNTYDRTTFDGRWINDSTIFHRYNYVNSSSLNEFNPTLDPSKIDHEFQINTEVYLDNTYKPEFPKKMHNDPEQTVYSNDLGGITATVYCGDVCQLEYTDRYTAGDTQAKGPKWDLYGERNWAVNMCIDDYLHVKEAYREFAFKKHPIHNLGTGENEHNGHNPYIWEFNWDRQAFKSIHWHNYNEFVPIEYDLKVNIDGVMICERKEGHDGPGSWVNVDVGKDGILNFTSTIDYMEPLYEDVQWERNLYRFRIPKYRFEYWHKKRHWKEFHHITHPMPVRIKCEMELEPILKEPTDAFGKMLPFIPIRVLTPYGGDVTNGEYGYLRHHVDDYAERNDDSRYDYAMKIEWNRFTPNYYNENFYSIYELP